MISKICLVDYVNQKFSANGDGSETNPFSDIASAINSNLPNMTLILVSNSSSYMSFDNLYPNLNIIIMYFFFLKKVL